MLLLLGFGIVDLQLVEVVLLAGLVLVKVVSLVLVFKVSLQVTVVVVVVVLRSQMLHLNVSLAKLATARSLAKLGWPACLLASPIS